MLGFLEILPATGGGVPDNAERGGRMAEAFPVSGNIESTSFPHLLVDLHRHGATGSLKVSGPMHPKQLFFRAGRILFGSSNDPRDHLGEILIEIGRITRDQLKEVNARLGPGSPLAKVLEESGFVNKREINDAARIKVERILADLLSWDSGSFEFEDGVLPKGAVDLKLSTERLLLAAVQRIPDRAFALRHVELSAVLEAAPEGETALSEVRAEVWPLLERLDGQRTLKDAIALTRLDEFEAAKTACAMLFLGIVRRKAGGRELDLAEEAQRGFGVEPPVYTAPAAPPAADVASFAFAEPLAPDFPAPEPAAETVVFPFVPKKEPEPTFVSPPVPEAVAAAETVAFPFVPKEEPEPTFVSPQPALKPFPEVVPAEPTEILGAPSFTMDTPLARKPTDTVPGDRPAYVPSAPQPPPLEAPPAPVPAPAAPVPEVMPTPAPASRPTREDLAALDALLSPSPSRRLAESPFERPRPERSEQPFRPPATPPRRVPARAVSSARSRVPLIAIGVGCVLATTVAAWYFFLRAPAARPDDIASATPAPPPVTVAEAPTPAPTAPAPTVEPTVEPMPSTTPSVTPAAASAATPLPPPTLAARPTPTPRAAPPSPAPAGEARALLTQGALPAAARAFAASMAPGARSRFSLQVLVACAPENVQKAVTAVPAEELFILPVNVNGRACYRLCWGVYDSRPAAEAALSGLPPYFRQGGVTPRLSPLAELLP